MKLEDLLDNTTSLRMPKKVLKRPKGLILTHRRCTAQWGENFSMVKFGLYEKGTKFQKIFHLEFDATE